MNDWLQILLLTLMAGLAMPIGAILASIERIHPRWLEAELRHSVIAFGGGALLAAVALVLIPEGTAILSLALAAFCFVAGALAIMSLDIILARRKTPASQLTAMLSDFIPEALALGAAFADNNASALLLALMIALQNLPEGFNAFRELNNSSQYRPFRIIIAFMFMAMLGPVAGFSGYFFLSDYPHMVAGLMLFASGGILYLMFQDIAPQAKLNNHWAPPLGAIAGFLTGIISMYLTSNTV